MHDLERAICTALEAYGGDTDKAGEPYIRHPLRVMQAVETDTERVVALLHDVVEDSENHTLDDIRERFDEEVHDAVECLTKQDGEDYLEEYIPRIAENDVARAVKRADIEDNLDLTRLPELDEDDTDRIRKYHRALQRL